MTQKIPDALTPAVDLQMGVLTAPWFRFFASFIGAPPAIKPISPVASPFVFVASARGSLAIVGGALTALTLTRGRVTVALPAAPALVPVSNGDTVTISYTGAPTLNFIEA